MPRAGGAKVGADLTEPDHDHHQPSRRLTLAA
jgi:hypothetical protein